MCPRLSEIWVHNAEDRSKRTASYLSLLCPITETSHLFPPRLTSDINIVPLLYVRYLQPSFYERVLFLKELQSTIFVYVRICYTVKINLTGQRYVHSAVLKSTGSREAVGNPAKHTQLQAYVSQYEISNGLNTAMGGAHEIFVLFLPFTP